MTATIRMQQPAQLTPLELTALGKFSKQAEKLRDELQPGHHNVDLYCHVSGTITIGANAPESQGIDTREDIPTAAEVLARVLAYVSDDDRGRVIASFKNSMTRRSKGQATKLDPEDLAEAEQLIAGGVHRTETPCTLKGKRGSVSASLTAVRIEPPPRKAARARKAA